ncbi:UvrD-helicase domain-containing protein [Pseudobdellovibrio sp. HCB154]|uniref:UvrD-helicase domain-containing protein n=1 Tax=Pseudobdellovibrio sp. HCB154 TaxID=3386277 RepID=UPI003916D30A
MSSQKFEIDFSQPQNKVQFIRAGAGAGKTTTLIATCIAFAKQFKAANGRYPKIIITTFTKKATQEIKERLIVEALETRDEELFQYFNKKSFVQIGTIHNILSLFIRQHSEAIGLPADLAIVNDYKIFFALKKHIKNVFEKNPQYQSLLDHYRFDQLIQLLLKSASLKLENPHFRAVDPETLKQAASTERESAIATIDQFLREAPEKWQAHVDFLKLIKAAVVAQDYEGYQRAFEFKPPRKFSVTKAKEISDELSDAVGELYKDDFLSPLCFDSYLKIVDEVHTMFATLVQEAFDFIEKLRLNNGEMSIADLELLSMKILAENPQAMQAFASQFDFIMVDEYQDTSPLQVKILNQLMQDKFQFIVGDPQQSIYLFRGARSEVFTNKEHEVNKQGFVTTQKMQNFRSHARLMTFMNDFFNHYSKQFKPMQTKNEDFVARSFPEASFVTATENPFAAIVTQAINLHKKAIPFSDITVLFRNNSDILKFAKYANQFNLPVQVQISKGFEDKSEVGDLLALLRFLINPFDNHNLIRLVRAPWFAINDQEIIQLRQDDSTTSFWLQLKKKNHPVYGTLKAIEKQYLEKGVSEALFQFIGQSVFLDSAMHFDPTSLREANIWKFMQTVMANEMRADFNLSDFVNHELTQFNSDLSSSDGEGIPLFAANRISLMTVHGSKGLQFKHVIVSGFNTPIRNSSTEVFTFDEETAQYSLRVQPAQFEKTFATAWADMVHQSFLKRAQEESDRVLYVALTRAIDSLSLVKKQFKKDPPKNSWLEKINWLPEQFASEKYNVEFLDVIEEPEKLTLEIQKASQALKPLNLEKDYRVSAGVTSLLSAELPYEKEATNAKPDRLAEELSEQTVKAYNKTQKGTDLHKFFESLKYNSINEVAQTLPDADRKALQWLTDQKEVNLREMFDRGHVEWGFGLKVKSGGQTRMVQGQIDAWGFVGEDLYILDYKTGSTKYLRQAFDQLRAYAGCLKQMGLVNKNQRIRLAVIYPFDQVVKFQDIFEQDVQLEFAT